MSFQQFAVLKHVSTDLASLAHKCANIMPKKIFDFRRKRLIMLKNHSNLR